MVLQLAFIAWLMKKNVSRAKSLRYSLRQRHSSSKNNRVSAQSPLSLHYLYPPIKEAEVEVERDEGGEERELNGTVCVCVLSITFSKWAEHSSADI